MDMLWSGWGDPAKAAPLPDSVTGLLRDLLGVKPRDTAAHALEEISVPEPLPGPALDALADAVGGAEHVRADAETRIRHTRGKSTPDLLRLRAGDAGDAPGPSSCPPPTTRFSPYCASAPNTASPSSRSAAAPPSSAASPRSGAPSSPSTCAA